MEWLAWRKQRKGMIRLSTGDSKHSERMHEYRERTRQTQSKGATIKKKNAAAKPQPAAAETIRSKQPARKAKSKLEQLEAMLRRPDGATVEKIGKALHWQSHSVRGAISGALKKKQGLSIISEKTEDGRRIYRIAA
jgi:hypothetical protein